jgi:hypothetical protein
MNRGIHLYVKSCSKCQMYKNERMKPCGYLGSVHISQSIFETIFVDFIGPHPPSQSRRNRFCLVVVDQLSNWVELFPIPSAQAKRVTEKLGNEVFCRFGSPKVIVSDNAKHFVNNTMRKLCRQWGIRHAQLSAYHPAPNRAERTNQDVIRMIAMFLIESHNQWDKNLQKFALALRTMANESTNVSPALLNLGRELALPVDRALQIDSTQTSSISFRHNFKGSREYFQSP